MIITNVECIKTDIKLSYECVVELFEAQDKAHLTSIYGCRLVSEDMLDDLYQEHSISHHIYIFNLFDFIKCESKLIPIMLKYKVLGNVYYQNNECSYNNKFFGYAFDGNGGYKKLDGEVIFKEAV